MAGLLPFDSSPEPPFIGCVRGPSPRLQPTRLPAQVKIPDMAEQSVVLSPATASATASLQASEAKEDGATAPINSDSAQIFLRDVLELEEIDEGLYRGHTPGEPSQHPRAGTLWMSFGCLGLPPVVFRSG